MPCLFLENVPFDVNWKPDEVRKLLAASVQILGGPQLEIHIRDVGYTLLTEMGEVSGDEHGVHGFIHWHEGRTVEQMLALGNAIQAMLDAHMLGEYFDLTFVGGPHGRSFYFDRQMVE